MASYQPGKIYFDDRLSAVALTASAGEIPVLVRISEEALLAIGEADGSSSSHDELIAIAQVNEARICRLIEKQLRANAVAADGSVFIHPNDLQ